ncbi:rhodanese-like domain-containing protein [Loktanella sp. 3ANDIMAR09]|uniref:rhodanese-like domain-containing protein n=1 Tax=Loktanella sp. 3ANDIMAR09 TaxID=1225657 RepID=UPI0009F83FB5
MTKDVWADVHFIDVRRAEDFATATIPSATHIEWRDIFGQAARLATNEKVVLFCNTGALSAQAAFGLRALGQITCWCRRQGLMAGSRQLHTDHRLLRGDADPRQIALCPQILQRVHKAVNIARRVNR